MMCNSKLFMPHKFVEEDTLTNTPRSKLNSDSDGFGDDDSTDTSQSPGNTPIGSPKSDTRRTSIGGDTDQRSDSGDDNGDAVYREDEYYAFLRELAGSFEATSEDEESELGSDSDGSSDEEENCPPGGRRRSSSCIDGHLGNSRAVSSQSVGHGQAKGTGSPHAEECTKTSGQLESRCRLMQPAIGGYPQPINGTNQAKGSAPSGAQQGLQRPPVLVYVPVGGDEEGAPGSPRRRMSLQCLDNRPPVVDDYDVVKATTEYAEEHSADISCFDNKRQEIEEAMRQLSSQAENLLGPARRKTLDPELRAHYTRVRVEHLAEVRVLEEALQSLIEAQATPATSSCSQAEAAQAAQQEKPFGAQGSEAQSIEVQ